MDPMRKIHVTLFNMAILALVFMVVHVATEGGLSQDGLVNANKGNLNRKLRAIEVPEDDDVYYTNGDKPANSKGYNGAYYRIGSSPSTVENSVPPKGVNGAYSRVGNNVYPKIDNGGYKRDDNVYPKSENGAYPRGENDLYNSRSKDNAYNPRGQNGAYNTRSETGAYNPRGDKWSGYEGAKNPRGETDAYNPRGDKWSGYEGAKNPRGETGAYKPRDDKWSGYEGAKNPRGETDAYKPRDDKWSGYEGAKNPRGETGAYKPRDDKWSGYEGANPRGYSGTYDSKDGSDGDNVVYHDSGNGGPTFSVDDNGASGNGDNDDTEAFEKTWDAACKASGATFLVPKGKKYLVNNIMFQGPCQPDLTFQVDGTIVAPENKDSWKQKDVWLQFWKVDGLKVRGSGTIDGQGKSWWADGGNKPTAVHFEDCNGLELSGLTILDSPMFHLTLANSDGMRLSSLKVIAPADSPNTDGIKTANCKHVLIEYTQIGTGDDCIALIAGSNNITIHEVTCGPGHGISIGSLGRENAEEYVTDVRVIGAHFRGTDNGVRIKTWQGGRGAASNMIFEDIEMEDVKNPVIIDQFYCPDDSCSNQTNNVQIEDITFRNITGTTSSPMAIKLECSETVPCKDITMENVILTGGSGVRDSDGPSAYCENALGKTIGTVQPPSCLE